MSMRLVQLRSADGARLVAAADDSGDAWRIDGVSSTYELALIAIEGDSTLEAEARQRASAERIDLSRALGEQRILAPIDHPDSAHLYLTGTGLTHLGSAEGRDKMHRAAASGSATDSMKMFLLGVEGGKPRDGEVGVQPEWFYKGDGSSIVAPAAAIPSPGFALDGSEEPEIAGLYVIDGEGRPRRLGYCLANEFSDHVTERANYLWLAHSKLRPAALGPELLTGALPADVRGTSRVVREGRTLWEKPFLTGEANMSHSLSNLEHHHFKYALFRRPGDVHVHFFGACALSFGDGIALADGDVMEVRFEGFGRALRNPVSVSQSPDTLVKVEPLG
jgi:hypothetical protein